MAKTIKSYIKWTAMWMRLVGMHTGSEDFFREKYYWIYTFFIHVLIFTLYNICQLLYILTHLHNIPYLMSHAFLTLTFVMCNTKNYFYLKNWPKIRRLIDQLDDDEFQPKNQRQSRIFESFFMISKFVHIICTVMVVSILVFWALIPILGKSNSLSFPYWTPFDQNRPILFEIAFAHQSLGLLTFLLTNLSLDMMCFKFSSYISTECDLLCDILSNMYEVTEERLEKEGFLPLNLNEAERFEKVIEGTKETLMYCIGLHLKIIRFAEDANSFCTVLLFLQFGSSLLSLCLTMYGLTLREISSFQLGIAGGFMCGLFTEILSFCYFSHEVIDKSTNIGVALYNTPWVDCPKPFKDNLLFFMLRTRMPIKMLALNFFEITLPTFVWILRCSWSIYVVLSRTNIKT